MIKRVIGIVFVVAVLAVVLNDGGRWFNAKSNLRTTTNDLSSWAASNARNMTREQAGQELVRRASAVGVRVYQYGQDQNGVQIWTEADVPGTWVLAAYVAVANGTPIGQALGTPLIVRDYTAVQFQ